jgi:hypothetical protein
MNEIKRPKKNTWIRESVIEIQTERKASKFEVDVNRQANWTTSRESETGFSCNKSILCSFLWFLHLSLNIFFFFADDPLLASKLWVWGFCYCLILDGYRVFQSPKRKWCVVVLYFLVLFLRPISGAGWAFLIFLFFVGVGLLVGQLSNCC